MTITKLTDKYRPGELKEVIGQEVITRSLRNVLKQGTSRTFLFVGPSGVGKTTVARIAARLIGCDPATTREIPAAKLTGVDDVRGLLDGISYKGFSKSKSRAFILDEVHRYSPQAWDALLKPLEEPPEHIFWFLCTTEADKVPRTVQTRATTYKFKSVPKAVIYDWLVQIAEDEKMFEEDVAESIIDLCAKEAHGSPRQALTFLGAASSAKDLDEAKDLISQAAVDDQAAIDLVRLLIKGAQWPVIRETLAGMRNANAESVRKVIVAYMNNVVLGGKKNKPQMQALALLQAFSKPMMADGIAPITLACAEFLFDG